MQAHASAPTRRSLRGATSSAKAIRDGDDDRPHVGPRRPCGRIWRSRSLLAKPDGFACFRGLSYAGPHDYRTLYRTQTIFTLGDRVPEPAPASGWRRGALCGTRGVPTWWAAALASQKPSSTSSPGSGLAIWKLDLDRPRPQPDRDDLHAPTHIDGTSDVRGRRADRRQLGRVARVRDAGSMTALTTTTRRRAPWPAPPRGNRRRTRRPIRSCASGFCRGCFASRLRAFGACAAAAVCYLVHDAASTFVGTVIIR